jgi:hypothetical protein
MMEAVEISETLVYSHQSTRRYNPEDRNHHSHRRENLKSHFILNKVQVKLEITNTEIIMRRNPLQHHYAFSSYHLKATRGYLSYNSGSEPDI